MLGYLPCLQDMRLMAINASLHWITGFDKILCCSPQQCTWNVPGMSKPMTVYGMHSMTGLFRQRLSQIFTQLFTRLGMVSLDKILGCYAQQYIWNVKTHGHICTALQNQNIQTHTFLSFWLILIQKQAPGRTFMHD